MILVLLHNGFEEVEALTPVDMLRRAGLDVKTVGMSDRIAVGSHGIPVVCDMTAEDIPDEGVSTVILPGGLPGATNLDADARIDALLARVYGKGGRLCAICAAPLVLGKRGYLKGHRATCFPGFEEYLDGAAVQDADVVTDGRITTGRSVYAAMAFAEEIVRLHKESV